MWAKKVSKTAARKRNVVAASYVLDREVEIQDRGNGFHVLVEDFAKDPQGGVMTDFHTASSLEAAKVWTEGHLLEKGVLKSI